MILLSSQIDPTLIKLIGLCFGIIFLAFILKMLKQPYVIAYIIAGVVLGPYGLAFATDIELIGELGSLGLVLLLFFVGMEISLPKLITNWKISVIGTLLQSALSVAVAWSIGYFLEWELGRILTIGFIISLSSTAVVVKLLQDRNEMDTRVGQNVLGILLAQDIFIVPMLIILNYAAGEKPSTTDMLMQIIGSLIIVTMIAIVLKKKTIKIPFEKYIINDHELQVFVAFGICFGFSLLTAFFGISSALGAFVAGILISSAKATDWVHESLFPFRVVFVALFFVSVGMLINLDFVLEHAKTIVVFLLIVLVLNTLINALVLRAFKVPWRESLYTGSILSQIGEFSFVLGATAFASGIIGTYAYQLTISIISFSLLLSPMWIWLWRKIAKMS